MLAASSSPVITADHLDTLEPQQMRAALLSLIGELAERDGVIARQGQEAVFKQAQIDKLTHENALLKRMKFAAQSERFSAEQKSLLDESLDERTCRRWPMRSSRPRRQWQAAKTSKSPNAHPCRPTCRGARSATSPSPPPAPAVAR